MVHLPHSLIVNVIAIEQRSLLFFLFLARLTIERAYVWFKKNSRQWMLSCFNNIILIVFVSKFMMISFETSDEMCLIRMSRRMLFRLLLIWELQQLCDQVRLLHNQTIHVLFI